jgi:hypothetical protein
MVRLPLNKSSLKHEVAEYSTLVKEAFGKEVTHHLR